MIGSLLAQWCLGAEMLDMLSHAVLALDETGRILFVKRAGEELLRGADGLMAANGLLAARRRSNDRRLAQLIAAALRPGGAVGGWLRLERPTGRAPLAVPVTPASGHAVLEAAGEIGARFTRAAVLAIVHDPEAKRGADAAALRSLYGLTPTQAQVTALLVEGLNAEAIAARLGMAPATVRVHLRNICRKTDVPGQRELVALVGSIGSSPAGRHPRATCCGTAATLPVSIGFIEAQAVGHSACAGRGCRLPPDNLLIYPARVCSGLRF